MISIGAIRSAVILLLCAFLRQSMTATSVICIVTPEGIIVGADSKFVGGTVKGLTKTVVIQDRIVVATVGTDFIDLRNRTTGEHFAYDFKTWMAHINKKCPPNVSVSALTELMRVETKKTFKDAAQFFEENRNRSVGNEYVIAGYEGGSPVIYYLHFTFDWKSKLLDGPHLKQTYPNPREDKIVMYGEHDVVDALNSPKSEGSKEIMAMIPKELPKINQQDLTRDEAIAVSIAVLKYETKHKGKTVGPPYIITAISRFGVSQKKY